jgi:hypothetical protein
MNVQFSSFINMMMMRSSGKATTLIGKEVNVLVRSLITVKKEPLTE